jgi:hypothetical protein
VKRMFILLACFPDAVQRVSGAPLIRDLRSLQRSRVCSAPLRAALQTRETTNNA